MSIDFVVKVEVNPINQIIRVHGMGKNGLVQRFLTNTVNRRITKYMPFRTGTLAMRSKYVTSPTRIEVVAPYAKYQYYGKAMAGSAPRVVTNVALNYTKSHHPLAGPYWDRRLMSAEGKAIANDVTMYIRRMK